MSNYKSFLLIAFAAVWVWAAIKPVYPHDWLLENYLIFIFVPLILISGRYFKLSDVSYTLITLHLILHAVGSHYTYAEVPFGYTLQHWLGAERNMFDRLVHFAFGFLWAYPMREIFMRLTKAKGFWSYYLPLDITLAFSAVYEIVEWLTARSVNSSAGLAFLGAQGDIWDAQKDMLMAGLGALFAMLIIALIKLNLNPAFIREFKASFKIPKNDEPLGEVKLKKLLKKFKR